MSPRLSVNFSVFGLVFFAIKSLLGIARQSSRKKICNFDSKSLSHVRMLIGPFIRGKVRPRTIPFIRACLSKTRTARINGSRLISVLDSFSCECCP